VATTASGTITTGTTSTGATTETVGPGNLGASVANAASGWWVFIAVLGGWVLSGSRAAPFVAGIMTIATLYQIAEWTKGQ
jgi:hypothetical protein